LGTVKHDLSGSGTPAESNIDVQWSFMGGGVIVQGLKKENVTKKYNLLKKEKIRGKRNYLRKN